MFLSGETHATCRRMRIPLWLTTAIHSMAAIPRKCPNTSIAGISWRGSRFDSKKINSLIQAEKVEFQSVALAQIRAREVSVQLAAGAGPQIWRRLREHSVEAAPLGW